MAAPVRGRDGACIHHEYHIRGGIQRAGEAQGLPHPTRFRLRCVSDQRARLLLSRGDDESARSATNRLFRLRFMECSCTHCGAGRGGSCYRKDPDGAVETYLPDARLNVCRTHLAIFCPLEPVRQRVGLHLAAVVIERRVNDAL